MKPMSHSLARHAAQHLWYLAQQPAGSLDRLTIHDTPSLPSRFHVGPLAAATIGVQALSAAQIWQTRTGRSQQVTIDQQQALAIFRSERYLRVDGRTVDQDLCPLFGYYQTLDGQWVQLHTNFAHHRNGLLALLDCGPTRDEVAAALAGWSAEKLETQLTKMGLVGSAIRTTAQWQKHPHCAALAGLPLFEIERIGDADPETIGRGVDPVRPLSGVRVLDLSRVIAAPVAARTLAQHGADVLAIGAPHLPNILPFLIDTGRGKRAASLDLRKQADQLALMALVRESDVFVQAYRPGALANKGFGPEALMKVRPGLVYVTLSAYGHAGPWAGRRGFDSLVQSATGIAHAESAGQAQPGKLPCQALDHATGYLAAFGAMVALQRRAQEGGSWLVRVSLAQTAQWLRSMGEPTEGDKSTELTEDDVKPWLQVTDSMFGRVSAIAPIEQMSLTPPRLDLPPVAVGTHKPSWLLY
jgi:crotonobetainyl-CoA:carnitine CoA-transferase CaiB-like acyl-CoA transferase